MERKGIRWLFLETFGRLLGMSTDDAAEKREHGRQLKAAMARFGFDRDDIAELTGVKTRTVTNWTSGATMPGPQERERLRERFPGYDSAGDPVEVAIQRSELDQWRQADLTANYRRHLHEQRKEVAG